MDMGNGSKPGQKHGKVQKKALLRQFSRKTAFLLVACGFLSQMYISTAFKCTDSHHKPEFIGENTTCYHFSYISVHFVFRNLLIKIHTCSTHSFNRSSALVEYVFSNLLHLSKSIYREKYSFHCCIRYRKGCSKFHMF